MQVGTRVQAKADTWLLKKGETGTYTSGEDYVPGWDAGRFVVTLDFPKPRMLASVHWTEEEMLRYWEVIE